MWGLDLSGSLQGAGGVGGLIAITDAAQGTHFAAFDGNGNVAAVVKASDGSVGATYEYGPFGELLRETEPMAKANRFRWSTQYQEDETDLVCYLHRYFRPSTGRWLSRDPIQEEGGLNVYSFVSDDPVNRIDKFGLASSTTPGVPHVSNDEHNNYLIFYATCPRGWSVTAVTVTYDSTAMADGMLTAAASDERRQWLLNYVYGGLKSVGRSNCRGEPVEVLAFMRTRLVSPALEFAAWRAFNALPTADEILFLYEANTQIHWLCNNCCGRGMSTR
jgi:RHS repeat-associated protein